MVFTLHNNPPGMCSCMYVIGYRSVMSGCVQAKLDSGSTSCQTAAPVFCWIPCGPHSPSLNARPPFKSMGGPKFSPHCWIWCECGLGCECGLRPPSKEPPLFWLASSWSLPFGRYPPALEATSTNHETNYSCRISQLFLVLYVKCQLDKNICTYLSQNLITVAKIAYYKRLWACFSVKSLINIGSCRLRFFGPVSKV